MLRVSKLSAAFMGSRPIRHARLILRLSCDRQARATARAAQQLRLYVVRSSVLTIFENLLASVHHFNTPVSVRGDQEVDLQAIWDHDRFLTELKQAASDSSPTRYNNR